MKVTIVYVSYRRDLIWLVHSLQLLFKFLKGNFNVVVRLDEDCREVVKEWGVPVRYCFLNHGWLDGYAHAMYQKMIADDYVDWDTDIIWLLDSDHMLMREAHVEDFIRYGKPLLHYSEWDDLDPDYARVAQAKWRAPTEKALGIPLDRDYMITPPMAFHIDSFRNTRQRITKVNGISLIDLAYSETPFKPENFMTHSMTICDYETLGLYAAKFEPDRYAIFPVSYAKDWPFKVYWSHGQFPSELGDLVRQ
jgi:hypothetical protein